MASASVTEWDLASVTELFESVDEAAKSVLSTVARAVIARGEAHENEVARSIELSLREVIGIVRELNEMATKSSHPDLISRQQMTKNLPNGRTMELPALAMTRGLADLVRIAERAEHDSSPHWLPPDAV